MTRPAWAQRTRDSGQTTILVLGLSLLAFAVAGVAIDGTRAFILRRTLQNAADSASVAGAGELNESRYHSSGGSKVVLDPGAAAATAERYLAARRIAMESAIESDPDAVYVVLRAESPTGFLRLVGIDAIPVAVESMARPQTELRAGSTLR